MFLCVQNYLCTQKLHLFGREVIVVKKLFLILMTACLCVMFLAGCAKSETYAGSLPVFDSAADFGTEDIPETTPEPAPQPLHPIYAYMLADGSYDINVESSSSMFRPIKAVLVVNGGVMNVCMTMSGQGYGYLYMGTGDEALAANEDSYIPFILDEEGAKNFTVPVEALNVETDCAAWSIRKEKWYDRVLIFKSDLIPADAIIKG